MQSWKFAIAAAALTGIAACTTDTSNSGLASTPNDTAAPTSGTIDSATGSSGTNGASPAGGGTTTSGGGAPSVPTLINVNLQNVLNNLSVSLQVNRDSVPVTAQVPIDVAAAVCGVSVDALAASAANGHGTCTATTTSPQLNQIVQQQISTGGNVQGGDQTLNNH